MLRNKDVNYYDKEDMTLIKVLIVDDSKLIRDILSEIITSFSDLTVVGTAKDAYEARSLIKEFSPDVITLDVEMPKMDGITFLKNLMRLRPMPVIMLSTLTSQGEKTTLEALEQGAIDFISKPRSRDLLDDLSEFSELLHQKIKLAAMIQLPMKPIISNSNVELFNSSELDLTHQILALGASTGGTAALKDILCSFPINSPPIVITQHIPASFSQRFAKRLNTHCELRVHEAKEGQVLKPGNVYIAPGGFHLTIIYLNSQYVCQLSDELAHNGHKPSVDIMFDSLNKLSKANVHAGLLTGMGNDGANGLLALKHNGHYTIVQDEQSSLIWGMPGSAYKLGAHVDDVPLNKIAKKLLNNISKTAHQIK